MLEIENVHVCYYPLVKIQNYFSKLKCKTPIENLTNVVYLLNCSNCESVYIGQTARHLIDRVREHKRDIKNNKTTSVIFNHCYELDHKFNFNDLIVLDSDVKSDYFYVIAITRYWYN